MINKLVLALLLSYAAAVPQEPKKADACAELAKAPSWKAARDCLTSFPYSEDIHNKTKDTVEKVVQLYVFYDIVQSSPDKQFQPDYDFPGALKKVFDKRDYKNDMEFQDAVSDAFLPLNDAHTGYMPYCYRQVVFAQPFYPVARVGKDKKTRLMIHGLAKDSKDYEKLLGGEILTINGEPAVDHIWNWALNGGVGLNKDAMTRFNRAVARVSSGSGSWKPYPGYYMMRARLPESESITYEIMPSGSRDPVTVTIPWKVNFPRGEFEDSESYWKSYCAQAGGSALKGEKILRLRGEGPALLPNEDRMVSLFPADTVAMFTSKDKKLSRTLKPEGDDLSLEIVDSAKDAIKKPLFSGGGVSYYTLESSDDIGVLTITTFSPPFGMTSYFRDTLAEIFTHIKKNQVKKLLIELSDNGGGSGCLASEVVALLTPHLWQTFPVVQNQYLKDERLSPLMEKLHHVAHLKNATSFDPKYWISAKTNKNFVGEEMYKPPRQRPHSKGKDPYPYTQLIRDDCQSPEDNPLLKIQHGLEPKDMAIISNGMCGSACGRVHFHLAELDAVKSVVVGGFKNRRRTASGFPATQVLDYEGVISEITELDLQDDKDMPHLLPEQTSLRFSVRQSYSRKTSNTPVEFVSLPADIELEWDSWTAMRPDRVWEQAAVELGWVPEWNKKVKKPESKS